MACRIAGKSARTLLPVRPTQHPKVLIHNGIGKEKFRTTLSHNGFHYCAYLPLLAHTGPERDVISGSATDSPKAAQAVTSLCDSLCLGLRPNNFRCSALVRWEGQDASYSLSRLTGLYVPQYLSRPPHLNHFVSLT